MSSYDPSLILITYHKHKKGRAVNLKIPRYKLYIGFFTDWNKAVDIKKVGYIGPIVAAIFK